MSAPKPISDQKTVSDLMRVSGLGRDSVRDGIRAGQLPGYVVGRRYVIPAKALEDFEHGRWRPQAAPPQRLRRRRVKATGSAIRRVELNSGRAA